MTNSTPKDKTAVKDTKTKKVARTTTAKAKPITTLRAKSATSAKKPIANKTAPKKTLSKTAPTSLKELNSSIASLETRMKRADTLTRKSVNALETAIITLDERTRSKSSTDKAALTRKVNELSSRLTDMVEQTQNAVNTELKTALSNPSVENLKSAIVRADQRLSQAEAVQTEAITKINRHLASMATAIDARIAQEETSRTQAIEALKAETAVKIDTVEQDTANALGNIGDKIVELSDEIKRRSEINELSIREKISEIALKTQTDFKDYKASLETQIETQIENAVEAPAPVDSGETRKLERTIFRLTSRLEELENNFNAVSSKASAPPPPPAPAPLADATPPILSVVATQPVTSSIPDAFTPIPQKTQTIPTPPYADTQVAQNIEPQAPSIQDVHIPQEFIPKNFQHAPVQKTIQPQLTPEPLPVTPPAPIPAVHKTHQASEIPQVLENIMPAPVVPAPTMRVEQNNNPLPSMDIAHQTYANPAYAENDDTMANIRIGGAPEKSFKSPKLSGRNLRVAALATGVAVLGLVATKGLLGNNDGNNSTQFTQNGAATPAVDTSQTGAHVVIEPIGSYADNKAPTVTGEDANTLNAAAGAGDSIAQFQLGLSYLEQGRTNEGVDLIRKSANQNQPAAQYRLAKLYEVGEGVPQDANMARQLTERAARNGNRIAMHDLALYYAEGRGGITAELPVAANWFKKAAERGVVDSQFNLGVLFESGQGLPKSMADAFVWYSIAASQGDQFAKKRIEVLSNTMTPASLNAAQVKIAEFKPVKIDETANGIFRNVAWAKPDTSLADKVTQVKEVQSLLNELGYDIGGADGSVGPRTRSAIISFEQANGLPQTGRVNTALLDRLELAAGA